MTMPALFTAEVLDDAWERVRANGGAPGVDGLTIEAFTAEAGFHLDALRSDLCTESYRPQPYRTVVVQHSGGTRRLVIATVRDRVAQTAAAALMQPIVEPLLHPSSFAYRPQRGVHSALAKMIEYRDAGFIHVLRSDIEKFFDTVPHEAVLMQAASAGIASELCALAGVWLTNAWAHDGRLTPSTIGLPQGLPISPLLANLYLTPFDRAMERDAWRLVRYADDFAVCCATVEDTQRAKLAASEALADLGLRLNAGKTERGTFDTGFVFLGATFIGRDVLPAVAHPYERDFAPPPPKTAAPRAAPRTGLPRVLLRTLYAQQQGAYVRSRGGRIVISKNKQTLLELPAHHVDQIFLFGRIHVSAPAMAFFMRRGIPISLFTSKGSYVGAIQPIDGAEFLCEQAQYRLVDQQDRRLAVARAIVAAKARHSRDLLVAHRRNYPESDLDQETVQLAEILDKVAQAGHLAALRGLEGAAAASYFRGYARCFRGLLTFTHRNRRPPTDPVNSLLSFGYTLLLRHAHAYLTARGLDANVGIFHESGRGHPALASDLIEEFRAPVIDRLVLTLANRGQFSPEDFQWGEGDPQPCLLKDESRGRFIEAFEKKLGERTAHPEVDHHVQWRQVIDLQALRMRRYILGQTHAYEPNRWSQEG